MPLRPCPYALMPLRPYARPYVLMPLRPYPRGKTRDRGDKPLDWLDKFNQKIVKSKVNFACCVRVVFVYFTKQPVKPPCFSGG